MGEILIYLVVAAVSAFAAYWYLKFKNLLPVEFSLERAKKKLLSFTAFSKDLLEHIYIPDTTEHYTDIVNYYMVKLNKVFPDSTMLVFEKSEYDWKLINYLKSFKSEPNIMSGYKWRTFDNVSKREYLTHMDLSSRGRFIWKSGEDISAGFQDEETARLFKSLGINYLIMFPFMQIEGNYKRIFVLGSKKGEDPENTDDYLKFLFLHINAIYKVSDKNISLKKENEQLKNELNALIKELDSAGTRLIQRAKERKALREVVTRGSGENESVSTGFSAMLSVVAKIMNADVAACLMYDDKKHELSVAGAYGIDEKDYYALKLENMKASSVRAFVRGIPFISNDAQNDSEVMSKYVKKWNINSLMVVPIKLRDKITGALRIGSFDKNAFNPDQLEFSSIVAHEIGLIMETFMLYDNLSETAKELARLNSVKDDFLATVSHELKTPLTTIKGFLEVILAGEAGTLTDEQGKFLNIISNAADRLHHLVSDLLDLSRLNGKVEMNMEKINVTDTVNESVSNLIFKAKEKEMRIETELENDLNSVKADKKWIGQVLDNLIVNAIKFSSVGGKIKVAARKKGDAVMIGVIDEGEGISKEDQRFIFDKFFRGKNNKDKVQGTGLGLAISKSVIDKHNGKIWVESEEGKGSKFFFVLPAKGG